MDAAHESRQAREETARIARAAARRAAFDLARHGGAEIISRPPYRGARTVIPDVEPLAGMRAAREIELGSRRIVRDYIRDAREAGHSWRAIGAAMDLTPGGEPDLAGETVAEAAFSYAAGHPDTDTARRYGRSVSWTCGSCEGLIIDHGMCNGPADDERGHAGSCLRLAAAVAERDAEWEAFDAGREAGQ